MASQAQDGFPEVGHQPRLLDVLGLECLQAILSWEVQRTMAAMAPAWPPPNSEEGTKFTPGTWLDGPGL